MKLRKLAAIAFMTVAALGISDGIAAAEPERVDAATAAPRLAQGTEQGIGFVFQRGEGATLDASLTGGSFRVTDDAIEVTAADGSVVASLPRAITVEDRVIVVEPRVTSEGAGLVADVSAQEIGYWRQTSPHQRSIEAGAGLGAGLGALVGLFAGVAIGAATMGLLLPLTLPAGLLIGMFGGMAIGGAAGASIPNSNVPDQWEYELECEYYRNYEICW